MRNLPLNTLIFAAATTTASAQVTVIANASELGTITNDSPAVGEIVGTGASSVLEVTSGRNREVLIDLGSTLSLANVNDFIEVSSTIQFDSVLADLSSGPNFSVGFSNSTTGAYYAIAMDVNGGSNEGQFEEDQDGNAGRVNINAFMTAPSTTPSYTFDFTVTRTDGSGGGADNGILYGLDGSISTSGLQTDFGDIAPIADPIFDQLRIRFSSGQATGGWNDEVVATFSDLSVTATNVVPEPGHYALIFLSAVGGMLILRRRKR